MVYDILCHIRFKNKEPEWVIKWSDPAHINAFPISNVDDMIPFFKNRLDAKRTLIDANNYVRDLLKKQNHINIWNRFIDVLTIQSLYFELCPIPYGEKEKIADAVAQKIGYEVTDEMKELAILYSAEGYSTIEHRFRGNEFQGSMVLHCGKYGEFYVNPEPFMGLPPNVEVSLDFLATFDPQIFFDTRMKLV